MTARDRQEEIRFEAYNRCKIEGRAAIRYSDAAMKKVKEGQLSAAWNLVDIATMAAKIAFKAHEELWEASNGELTEDEAIAFDDAEMGIMKARRAAKAAAEAVRKLNEKR